MVVALANVTVVAAAAEIPDIVRKGPVRVVLDVGSAAPASPVYLVGSVESVRLHLATIQQPVLGLLVDREGDLDSNFATEVVPGLAAGFSSDVWEDVTRRVCSKHLVTIQEMIAERARETPDKLMLVFDEKHWTFKESLSLAGSLLGILEARGCSPEHGAVAVQMDASDLLVITYLALFCGGYVAHVVDGHPKTRAYKLSVFSSQLLLCMSSAEPVDTLPVLHIDTLRLDSSLPVESVKVLGELSDTAFVEYTSGSTGNPKAVATKQWRIAHWVRWRQYHFPLVDSNDRVATNLFFIWYWHVTPACGGTVVVYPNALNHDMVELMKYIDKHKCQKIESITPGLLGAILSLELQLPPSVKIVVSGGEGLPIAVCKEWLQRFPDVAFWNNLATTETASDVCFCRITADICEASMLFAPISAGMVCWNNQLELHGEELVMTGWNVADAYLPPTVTDKFTVSEDGRKNIYRTGDRAKYVNGYLYMLGRQDSTTKIRGFRVDLAGLEAAMDGCQEAIDIAFVAFRDSIWGAVVTNDLDSVKKFAREHLQHENLIVWQVWEKLPYTLSAKRNRKEILRVLEESMTGSDDGKSSATQLTAVGLLVCNAWQKMFGRKVGHEERFGEIGGHSLLAMKLAKELGMRPAEVFMYPTISSMVQRLEVLADKDAEQRGAPPVDLPATKPRGRSDPIAIVGMSGRFPGGVKSYYALWQSLKAAVDLTSDVPGAGPNDVPRKGIVPTVGFDHAFWGLREEVATMMDTAQKAMLELAYESLGDAGFDPFSVPGRVGAIFSGSSLPHYHTEVLGVDLDVCRREKPDEYFQLEIGIDKDYLATLVAYHLNLHGPAFSLGTACSSSLAAAAQAVTVLRHGATDYMLAGGVSFSPDSPVRKVDGMIWSPDGKCRPFAEGANGTINSDGGAIVVLAPLEVAMANQDWIFATVLGCGMNNDGARKASFSAPSHEGQVEAIRLAMAEAGVSGDDYDYVEAHGTGTKLGDPIEVWALTEALSTRRKVGLGSVKGNIGHLNTAAGICGLVKVSEMFYHQEIVPSRYAEKPTSLVDWESTPLVLATKVSTWNGKVAGVSSFGIGGTNIHLTLGASPVPQQEGFAVSRDGGALPNVRQRKTPNTSSLQGTSGLDKLFYESFLEKVTPSCIPIQKAVVVLDGEFLPSGLSVKPCVVADPERAVAFACNTDAALFFVGTCDDKPKADDESQADLLTRAMSILTELAKSKKRPELFFILRKNVRYAGLCGFLRTAAKEHPELRMKRLMIVDPDVFVPLPAMPAEYEIHSDGIYSLRIRQASAPEEQVSHKKWGAVLVTGGLRGLGLKVAAWLAASGRASKLVLVGRSEPKGPAKEEVKALQEMAGIELVVHCCDVSVLSEVETLPESCDLVIHAAGAVKDGLILKTTKQDATQVLLPKVRGGLNLMHRYPHARFLGFSSTSGLFGSVGQGTYAFANTFLDSIMPTIQWGGWSGAGMAEDLGIDELPGERFIPIQVGLDCLGRVLDVDVLPPPVVLDCNWGLFRQNGSQLLPDDPLLSTLPLVVSASSTPSALGKSTNLPGKAPAWEMVLGPSAGTAWGTHPAWRVCLQHIVDDVNIFPGSGFVTLAFEALKEVYANVNHAQLGKVSFLRPLHLSAPRRLRTTLTTTERDAGMLRFASVALEGAEEIVHCTCAYSFVGSAPQELGAWSAAHFEALEPLEGVYQRFSAAGFHYGPSFQAGCVKSTGMEAFGMLPQTEADTFLAPPAALDVALQIGSLIHPRGCRGVPQAMSRVIMHSTERWQTAVAMRQGGAVDIHLVAASGQKVCTIEGLDLALLTAAPDFELFQRVERRVYPEDERGRWLMRGELVKSLDLPDVTLNESDSHEAFVMAVNAQTCEDVQEVQAATFQLAAQKPCWVLCLEAPLAEAAAAAVVEAGGQALYGGSLEDLRKVAASVELGPPRALRVHTASEIFEEVLSEEALEVDVSTMLHKATPEEPFKVTVDPSMGVQGARSQLCSRQPPAADQVEVRAGLWALNFRDVLVAVGAIPMEVAGHSLGLGGECYGEVVSVGADVSGLAVGDLVVALPPDGLGSFVTVDARWVTKAPPNLSPEEAVAGTAVYATAWLGLLWQGHLCPGERVLIHSAAGGVGLAAVHLCLCRGCEVHATASTEEKRRFLLGLGVTAVYDSRSPERFEKGVREATAGQGVDVVLNSLSGEAIPASLRLLRPFGRFIEIGKRDQYEGTGLNLEPFLKGLTYTVAHLDVLTLEYPERGRKLLEEVWSDLHALPKLPTKTFRISDLHQALEYFSKGVHIGKVLISIDGLTPVWPARAAGVIGPKSDRVAASLREALDTSEASGGIVCVPNLAHMPGLPELQAACLILAGCHSAAVLASKVCPAVPCVELRSWDAPVQLDAWMQLGPQQLVAVEKGRSSSPAEGDGQTANLGEWLMEVAVEMAGEIGMDQSFEDAGLDSLSLISLARRLTAKMGRSVSVVDIYDNPTPRCLLIALTGSAQAPQLTLQRPKVLCLHGFRSNKDAMELRLAPFARSLASVFEWIFVNSPQRATGPADPRIEQTDAYEWYGEVGGAFETAWQAQHSAGYEESLTVLRRVGAQGVIGFSQGGSMASALARSGVWCALFSAMVTPNLSSRCSTPSFHSWDPSEEYVAQCKAVHSLFDNAEVCLHDEGHDIPQNAAVVKEFVKFAVAQTTAGA